MQYKLMDSREINRDKWKSFVLTHPNGTVFHTDYMFDLYSLTPKHDPFILFAINNSGSIEAIIPGYIQKVIPWPFSLVSSRCIVMQSPLYVNPIALDFLLNGLRRYVGNRVIYTEIRSNILGEQREVYESNKFFFEDHLNIINDLTSPLDDLWKMVVSRARTKVRKAERNGLVPCLGDVTHLREAYSVLQHTYKREKLPLIDYSFFEEGLITSNVDSGMEVFIVILEGVIIHTQIIMRYKKKLYAYYGGILDKYKNTGANDLLTWFIIKWGHDHGFTELDFGGAGKPSVPYGVRDYKLKFGGKLDNFGRFKYVNSPLKYTIASKGFELLRKLKRRWF